MNTDDKIKLTLAVTACQDLKADYNGIATVTQSIIDDIGESDICQPDSIRTTLNLQVRILVYHYATAKKLNNTNMLREAANRLVLLYQNPSFGSILNVGRAEILKEKIFKKTILRWIKEAEKLIPIPTLAKSDEIKRLSKDDTTQGAADLMSLVKKKKRRRDTDDDAPNTTSSSSSNSSKNSNTKRKKTITSHTPNTTPSSSSSASMHSFHRRAPASTPIASPAGSTAVAGNTQQQWAIGGFATLKPLSQSELATDAPDTNSSSSAASAVPNVRPVR